MFFGLVTRVVGVKYLAYIGALRAASFCVANHEKSSPMGFYGETLSFSLVKHLSALLRKTHQKRNNARQYHKQNFVNACRHKLYIHSANILSSLCSLSVDETSLLSSLSLIGLNDKSMQAVFILSVLAIGIKAMGIHQFQFPINFMPIMLANICNAQSTNRPRNRLEI